MLDRTRFDWIAEQKAKTDEALALVQGVVDWFFANYEESSSEENAPYDGGLGHSVYPLGEPHTAREWLDGRFDTELATFDDDERAEIIAAAVDEIEDGRRMEWVEKPSPANVPLLRAHDHYWGRGHVHRFEADIGKTTCGKRLENYPGDMSWGNEDDINCKACLRMIERQRER